jgi:hypothetical protein
MSSARALSRSSGTRGGRLTDPNCLLSGGAWRLGAVMNAYGNVGLFRRAVLDNRQILADRARPDWPLMAELAAGRECHFRAHRLGRAPNPPGSVRHPSGALLVVQQLELALPDPPEAPRGLPL